MYGLVEVHTDTVKQAYRLIKGDCSKMEEEQVVNSNTLFKKRVNKEKSSNVFNEKQKQHLKEILEDLVYASYISSNEFMLIKVEIAGIIQDIICTYTEEMETQHV